jgi:predicted NUDIX family phosphoesterase
MPTEESVLVIPTTHFRAAGYFHGFRPADDAYRVALLDPGQFSFRPRREVETDPAFKQIIPYLVLRCGGAVFHYRRGGAGTESRLAALRSVGIGGHVSDASAADPYRAGMLRELSEEVEIGRHAERLVGFINDDGTAVGSVHLGVVHLFELEAPAVRVRDAALSGGGFAPPAELLARRAEFETWSQFVLDWIVTNSPTTPGRSPG